MLTRDLVPAPIWIAVLAPLVVLTARAGWLTAAALLLGSAAICGASLLGYADDWRQVLLETACFLLVAVGAPHLGRLGQVVDAMPAPGDAIRVAPLLPTPAELPASLSRRERDVVLLAAQGLRSVDIGAELFISQRTVESHLANAYGKLHLHSRAELIALVVSLAREQPPATAPAAVAAGAPGAAQQHGWLEGGARGAA
jgi:DNA-binding CsgD family transcriptional regulator